MTHVHIEITRPVDTLWMDDSACQRATPEEREAFFWGDDVDEPDYPSDTARSFCDRCVVRSECLTWANDTGQVGVWGGLSTQQRRAIGRTQPRKHCPGCGASVLITEGRVEICLACGVSWPW